MNYQIAIGKLDRKNLASPLLLTVEFYNEDGKVIGDEAHSPSITLAMMAGRGWDFKGVIEVDRDKLFVWQSRKFA